MHIFTRRNALIGWIVLRVARRKLKQRLGRSGNGRRRGLLAGAGLAATGTAVALYARHGNGKPAEARG
jgi:hypothetical protein